MIPRLGDGNPVSIGRFSSATQRRLENDSPSRGRKLKVFEVRLSVFQV